VTGQLDIYSVIGSRVRIFVCCMSSFAGSTLLPLKNFSSIVIILAYKNESEEK